MASLSSGARPLNSVVRRHPIVSARTNAVVGAVILGVVAGAAYPFVDVALSCRVPTSEACVWGKAYLPLSLGISIPLIGGIVGGVAYALWTRRNSGARKGDDV